MTGCPIGARALLLAVPPVGKARYLTGGGGPSGNSASVTTSVPAFIVAVAAGIWNGTTSGKAPTGMSMSGVTFTNLTGTNIGFQDFGASKWIAMQLYYGFAAAALSAASLTASWSPGTPDSAWYIGWMALTGVNQGSPFESQQFGNQYNAGAIGINYTTTHANGCLLGGTLQNGTSGAVPTGWTSADAQSQFVLGALNTTTPVTSLASSWGSTSTSAIAFQCAVRP